MWFSSLSLSTSPSISLLLVCLIACIFCVKRAEAVVLSYELAAFETACFHENVGVSGKKIYFYYAVQSENSDLEATVYKPNGEVLHKGKREVQSDQTLTAEAAGEYSFCFSNGHSSSTTVVEFDISVETDAMHETNSKDQDKITPLEAIIKNLDRDLQNMLRYHKYFRAREARNMETVVSTESRIYYFALLECLAIVGMSIMQVYVVKTFFSSGKGRSRI